MQKFQMVNWVPAKLGTVVTKRHHMRNQAEGDFTDIPVNVDDELLLDDFMSSGKQDGEVEIEEEGRSSSLVSNSLQIGSYSALVKNRMDPFSMKSS